MEASMGSGVLIQCKCGYDRQHHVGGGMSNFRTMNAQPALCRECNDVVLVNFYDDPLKCMNCWSENVTPYGDELAKETPVEETPVEETPVEETPVEETPVEETPVEETPVEEAQSHQGGIWGFIKRFTLMILKFITWGFWKKAKEPHSVQNYCTSCGRSVQKEKRTPRPYTPHSNYCWDCRQGSEPPPYTGPKYFCPCCGEYEITIRDSGLCWD
jgi:hypothetical protein